ncbi:MAG: hydroxypyruvate isomerase [Saprospiraceae bacterium]|jgi:hydroxypyruvate isomerase
MDGDIIRNSRKYSEYIGHVQVADVPGRGEIGLNQEVNYPAVAKAFLNIGNDGYFGHEWIPTGDPMTGLRESVLRCAA